MTIRRSAPPRKMSDKKRRSLGDRPVYSTVTGERKLVKKVNRKRRSAEWVRAYGSEERVEWVKAKPCAACGVEGFTENAHVGHEGAGAGRKANADQIGPLCGPHWARVPIEFHDGTEPRRVEGCHRQLHRIGPASFEKEYGINLPALASDVARQWEELQQEKGLI